VRERSEFFWWYVLYFDCFSFFVICSPFSDYLLDPPDPFSESYPFGIFCEYQSVSSFWVPAQAIGPSVQVSGSWAIQEKAPAFRDFLQPSQKFWFQSFKAHVFKPSQVCVIRVKDRRDPTQLFILFSL